MEAKGVLKSEMLAFHTSMYISYASHRRCRLPSERPTNVVIPSMIGHSAM